MPVPGTPYWANPPTAKRNAHSGSGDHEAPEKPSGLRMQASFPISSASWSSPPSQWVPSPFPQKNGSCILPADLRAPTNATPSLLHPQAPLVWPLTLTHRAAAISGCVALPRVTAELRTGPASTEPCRILLWSCKYDRENTAGLVESWGQSLGVGCRQEMTHRTTVRVSKSSGVATGKRRATAHRARERGIWKFPQQEDSPDTGRYSRGLVASAQSPAGPLCSYSTPL